MRRPPFPTLPHPSVTPSKSCQNTQHTPLTLFSPPVPFFSHFITHIRLLPSPLSHLFVFPPLPRSAYAPGCCSDTEADSGFRMANTKDNVSYRRSVSITPKASVQFNQFLPSKDKPSGYVPAPLRKKRAERNDDSRRSWANPSNSEDEGTLTRYCLDKHCS